MLSGEKVILRPVSKDDLPRLWEFRQDVELVLLGDDDPPIPQPYDAFESFMTELLEKTDENVMFAIEAEGELIGSISLYHLDTTSRSCELGIVIGSRDHLGKGYGTDAVRTVVDYAFRYRNFHRVYLGVTASNERAIASYRKAGFVEEGRFRDHIYNDGEYRDMVFMGILSSDPQPEA